MTVSLKRLVRGDGASMFWHNLVPVETLGLCMCLLHLKKSLKRHKKDNQKFKKSLIEKLKLNLTIFDYY